MDPHMHRLDVQPQYMCEPTACRRRRACNGSSKRARRRSGASRACAKRLSCASAPSHLSASSCRRSWGL